MDKLSKIECPFSEGEAPMESFYKSIENIELMS